MGKPPLPSTQKTQTTPRSVRGNTRSMIGLRGQVYRINVQCQPLISKGNTLFLFGIKLN